MMRFVTKEKLIVIAGLCLAGTLVLLGVPFDKIQQFLGVVLY